MLVGASPILMSNGAGADPPSDNAKMMVEGGSKKRGKTDGDHAALARVEFESRLYFDKEVGVYVPGDAVHATFVNAAKSEKLGRAFQRAVTILEDKIPLIYPGRPKKYRGFKEDEECEAFIDALYGKGFFDRRPVVMQGRRVPRTRPMFPKWGLLVEVTFAAESINPEDIMRVARYGGSYVGLCDYRPKFGRFSVEKVTDNMAPADVLKKLGEYGAGSEVGESEAA
jgi:hypothetical protein